MCCGRPLYAPWCTAAADHGDMSALQRLQSMGTTLPTHGLCRVAVIHMPATSLTQWPVSGVPPTLPARSTREDARTSADQGLEPALPTRSGRSKCRHKRLLRSGFGSSACRIHARKLPFNVKRMRAAKPSAGAKGRIAICLSSFALDKVAPPRGLGPSAKVEGETVPSRSRGRRCVWRDAGVPSVGEL